MKIKLIWFLLSIPFFSFSQDLFVGAKGGLNVSNISTDPNNHAKIGLHAGAYVGYKFHEKMAASVEILYTQKGSHHTGTPPVLPTFPPPPGWGWNVDGDMMIYIDYIDLPMLFHYYFSPEFSVHGGLTFGVPVRGIRSYRNPPIGDQDFLKEIHQSVISFPIGINYEIAQRLNFGIRGDLGLSPIGGNGHKNIVFMVSVGYTFFRKGTTLKVGKGGGNDKSSSKEKK